jgi:L-methionine (R)-S-oxide reductase
MFEPGKLVKRIQEMRDEGYLSDAILRESVKQIKVSDVKYHWVGVYLLNPEEKMLWLHNYMGEGTDHAQIPVGSGICGTAVAEGKNQNVGDVSKVENYLPCSPHVQSELVVLIRAGEDIFGQLDIDSHEERAFGKTDEENVQLVADKLAEVFVAERR